jgi:hypothetical protein
MIEVRLFPIYGLMFGLNYWNDTMDDNDEIYEDCQHIIQLMFLIFGISFIWYEKYK